MPPLAAPATAEDRRALLKRLLAARDREAGARPAPAIVPDPQNRFAPFPLTEIQEAYWLGRRPGFPLGGVGIHGYFEIDCRDLDLPRLEAAWNAAIARHDMMRAVVLPDGTARIMPTAPTYRIAVEDLSGAAPDARAARLAALREGMAHRVYDVARWPLFEIRAVRLDARTTRLLYGEDAIHLDLAGSALVARDWVALYRGEALPAPPTLGYRDVALALDARRGEAEHARALAAWRARLPDLPDPPALPRKTPDTALAMRFARRTLRLAPADWAAFKSRAAARDLTASDALLTAYADVLGAWSETPRFLLNVTVQNRPPLHPEIDRVAGDFTSFTLLDVETGGDVAFHARATRHRDRLWERLADGAVSGVTLLRERAALAGTDTALAPFVYTSALGTPGYRALEALGALVHEVTQTPQVLLDQQALEVEGALALSWDVVEDAFPDGVIEAAFGALERLLRDLAGADAAWERGGPLPLPPDQRAARRALDDTAGPFPRARLEELFARTAARRGDAPALLDADGALSFAALHDRARALAGALQEAGIGAETPVAIALPRGRDQIVAVLATLIAGAPYCACDLSAPAARVAAMLARAGCRHAIVDPAAPLATLPATVAACPVDGAGPPPRAEIPRSEIAYVLFTSGSTGRPKAVPIRHAAVVNRMDEVVARFGLGPSDRGLALTALHHDLSVFDLFGLMAIAGGALVLPPAAAAGPGDPRAWAQAMARHGVGVWNSVPAFLEMLLAARPEPEALAGLRRVFLSGDFIPLSLPEALARRAPQARVVSLGGPTETCVWDVCHPIEGPLDPAWPSVPYGRPMRNARYSVRRADLSECPDWVAGELCIAGVGLSPGYLDPEPQDAARFVADPASGERLYRSGDRGRIRPGGLVEILGRADREVKIAGHRLALGDVEAALRRCEGVGAAVAFAHETQAGGRVLAAAVTPAADAARRETLAVPRPAGPPRDGVRRSARVFGRRALPAAALARLLSAFRPRAAPDGAQEPCGDGGAGHLHPSAGGLDAVIPLVHVREDRVAGLAAGLYRLDRAAGRLARLGGPARLDPAGHAERNRSLAADAAATLILAADRGALEDAYGAVWRDLALLEAGYMGQLAAQAAAEAAIALCPLGGLDLAASGLALPDGLVLAHALLLGTDPAAPASAAALEAGVLDLAALRAELAETLPPHAVPAILLALPTLPLTVNGKPDASALARLAEESRGGAERPAADAWSPPERAPPRAAAPAAVAADVRAAVADVLGLADPPPERPLRELGATSVDLVRIHARLLEAGYPLPVTDLFAHPSLAALVAHLGGAPAAPEAGESAGAAARGATRREALAHRNGRRGDA
ncbi:amino acid adenylation domain-containing protein [Salinarimonas sp.]|uniref:amino acid adenylation domain-containing protein n=1 Tax=Salinarimonas sp. TaxID=2766526 RepID=UPI0032D8F476